MQKEAWGLGGRFVLKKGKQGLESKSNSTDVKKSLASKKGNQGLELRRNLGSGRRPLIRITLAQHHCPKHWHYYVITILHSHRERLVQCRRKLDVFYLA